MSIFDKDGMMIFPNPTRKEMKESKNVLVVKECFCQNGHSLISKRATFSALPSVMLKVKTKSKHGLVALSPIFGDKSKITLDIDLETGELLELICPICDSKLPVYSKCPCGGDLVALFLTNKLEYSSCVGLCSRVNCFNAEMKSSSDLIKQIVGDAGT
jgi:hypothetical protein